jgi:hypothetical protein
MMKSIGAALVLGLGVTLGSCAPFSDVVADHWPHLAGGEPSGLPPRPGDPGYAAFIAHDQPSRNAAAPGVAAPGAKTKKPAAANQAAASRHTEPRTAAPAANIAAPAGADWNAVQGGLY